MINTLEEALARIKELEEENKNLLSELEYYRNRNYGGRKKHNEAWMAAYNDFVVKYEGGMAIMEIVAEGDISRRTAYRYKAYYDELKKMQDK
jgi:hypothetical protein